MTDHNRERELKPFDERECEHCLGLICVRMPVPSSNCDHLYYPDYCKVCKKRERDRNPSTEDVLKKKLDKLWAKKEIMDELLKTAMEGRMTPQWFAASVKILAGKRGE